MRNNVAAFFLIGNSSVQLSFVVASKVTMFWRTLYYLIPCGPDLIDMKTILLLLGLSATGLWAQHVSVLPFGGTSSFESGAHNTSGFRMADLPKIRIDSAVQQRYDSSQQAWVNFAKILLVRNSEGLIVREEEYVRKSMEDPKWYLVFTTHYTFDAAKKLISRTLQEYLADTVYMMFKTEYTYNGEGKVVSVLKSSLYPGWKLLKTTSKEVYTYANGRINFNYHYSLTGADTLALAYQRVYAYDVEGRNVAQYQYRWNQQLQEYDSLTASTLFEYNYYTMTKTERRSGPGVSWILLEKSESTYDWSRNLVLLTEYTWDVLKNDWRPQNNQEFTYDDVPAEDVDWGGLQIDFKNRLTHMHLSSYSSKGWELSGKLKYYYSDIVTSSQDRTIGNVVLAYASGSMLYLAEGVSSGIDLKVYDLQGRQVFGQTVTGNVSLLAFTSGLYLFEASSQGQVQRGRFVVE